MDNKIRLLTKDDIEVKVKQITAKGALGLLYKTARVDRAILDDTFGAMNWQCRFEVINENLYCEIGVYNPDIHEWVWKSDCGVESETEAEKGEASDAFKRAGFKWGIGVELYNSPFIWLNVPTTQVDDGKGGKKWALSDRFQRFEIKSISVSEARDITELVIVDAKTKDVVFSFGSSEKAKPIEPETSNAQAPAQQNAPVVDIEHLRKETLALGASLIIEDRKKIDDWLHKTFNGDTVADTQSAKVLFTAKKVYQNAKKKEEEEAKKNNGNVSLEEADKLGTDPNDGNPF